MKKFIAPAPVVDPTKLFNEDKIVLSFGALSDTQHAYAGIDTLGKFKTALTQLKAYAEKTAGKLDAVVFAGDLVQSAKTSEAQQFKGAYETVIDPAEIPLVFTLGNHDVKLDYTVEDLNMESFYNIFGDVYRVYDEETSDFSIGCTHTVINDYHFLNLTPITESYSGNGDGGVLYSDEVKAWLDETLSAITTANPEHYVFVNTHPIPFDTAYGSDLVTSGTRWFTKDLTAILEKYNQVVTFGGHIHFPLNDPRSIMQTSFTSLGCAAVSYMAIENGGYENMSGATVMRDSKEYSQGLLVQVDENGNMRITRMDFYNGTTIGDPWFTIAPTSDGAHLTAYTKERGSKENNTAPGVSEIKAVMGVANSASVRQVTIKFTAAEDDEFAHHYALKIVRKTDGRVLKDVKILSDFYRHGNPADMKSEFEFALGGLKDGTECEVTLTAYDSWNATCESTYSFTVSGNTDTPAAEKASVYVDFDFVDGKIVDTKGNGSV